MGMEVGKLSSIELSGFERLVAWETLSWEGDGSQKVGIAISLESTKNMLMLD